MKYKNILPTERELLEERTRFRVTDTTTGENVLGGDVCACNAHLLNIERFIEQGDGKPVKHVLALAVNESCFAAFRCCGTRGVYKITRVL